MVQKAVKNIGLYLRLTRQNVRSQMEYKNDFIMSTIAGAIWQSMGIVFLFALFNNINTVAGWDLYEMALLYASIMFGEGAVTFLFQGITTGFSGLVRRGEFDRYMIRPASITTQLMGIKVNFAGVFTMITSICLIVYSFIYAGVSIDVGSVLLYIINLCLGVWIRLNLNIMANSMTFIVQTSSALSAMLYDVQNYGKYPLTIFPKALQFILIVILPYAMIAYVPVCLLLGRLPIWPYALSVPTAGIFMNIVRRWIFNFALKRYESAGN